MASAQWAGLNEQHRLEAIHHSEADNKKARLRCLALINHGHGSIDWD